MIAALRRDVSGHSLSAFHPGAGPLHHRVEPYHHSRFSLVQLMYRITRLFLAPQWNHSGLRLPVNSQPLESEWPCEPAEQATACSPA
jgi:hypothetical protein